MVRSRTGERTPDRARRVGLVFVLVGAALALTAAVAAVLGPRVALGRPGVLYDVYTASIVVAALSCLARAVMSPVERLAWSCMSAALATWAAGNVYSILELQDLAAYPVLSAGDAFWMSWYPLVGAGLVSLLRRRIAAVPRNLWLDGIVVGAAAGALYAATILDSSLHPDVGNNPAAVFAAFAYPIGDMLLLAFVASILGVHGWRLSGSWAWLVAGLLASTVIDGAYLSSHLTDRVLYGCWPLVGVALARAAWHSGEKLARVEVTGRRMFVAPAGCALVILAVFLYAAVARVNLLAVGLAAVSFLALLGRVGLLFADVRRAAAALEQARAEADHLSRVDPLTGTANRRAFGEAMKDVRSDDIGTGILLVDIDHFKGINDRYGHDAGDAVIVEVTRRMTANVRRDDVVGRWGGEEFCALLRRIPSSDVLSLIAENLRLAVCDRPIDLPDGRTIKVTVSIGAVLLDHVTTLDFAINAADKHLYEAKGSGRNQVRAGLAVHP